MKGLESRLARGGVWMVAMRFGVKVLGFVSTMIVARILTPADYGIIAIAIGIVGIMEVLGELGFDMALIRNREATNAHYNTAWTVNGGTIGNQRGGVKGRQSVRKAGSESPIVTAG
ncbi:MAG: hypothetical protein FJY37_08215, partial [Betaproteobacteria bacterium]|nr:hypothetical protein [Betaproteobacteria bacterium]